MNPTQSSNENRQRTLYDRLTPRGGTAHIRKTTHTFSRHRSTHCYLAHIAPWLYGSTHTTQPKTNGNNTWMEGLITQSTEDLPKQHSTRISKHFPQAPNTSLSKSSKIISHEQSSGPLPKTNPHNGLLKDWDGSSRHSPTGLPEGTSAI